MTRTIIDGWEYGQKEDLTLYINPPEGLKKDNPSSLFKYYALNKYSLQVLSELKIYAPNPLILNDPFDSHDSLINFDNNESIERMLKPVSENTVIKEAYEANPQSLSAFASYNFRLVVYSRLGIYCMTERPTNLLMWSYYTGHKGFCIEFDYKLFPFKYHGPFQINYQKDYTPISINKSGWICALYQSNVKAIDWQHEQEWRLLPEREGQYGMETKEHDALKGIKNTTDRYFDITKECIKKIILGNQFFDNENELSQVGAEVKINLRIDSADLRNDLLNIIEELKIPVEIIFRNINSFGFNSVPVKIIRTDVNSFTLIKNEA